MGEIKPRLRVHPFRFGFRRVARGAGCCLGLLVLGLWAAGVFGRDRSAAQSTQAVAGAFRPDRILVKPKPGEAPAKLASWHDKHHAKVLRRFPQLGDAEVVQLPPGADVPATLARYQASGLVECAEPDYYVHAHVAPNDPFYADGSLWGLDNTGQNGGLPDADIDAPEGWDTLNSSTNIIVAVIDSGVRYTHEDLAANMWRNPGEVAGNNADDDHNGIRDDVYGINAITDSGDPNDDNGHGTHIAGIIGPVGNNGRGLVGVAWRVQIMALKFMDPAGNGSMSDAIQCLDYARAKGAKVINASWGSTNASTLLNSAIDRARQAGIIFVASSGNEGLSNDVQPSYPANSAYDNIVAVTATTRIDSFYPFGNYGATSVDLAAPGSAIVSTWFTGDNQYATSSGTSMAAAYVSGALALVRARFPDATYRQLIDRVLTNTTPLVSLADKCATGGRLNLAKALGPATLPNFTKESFVGTQFELRLHGEPGRTYAVEATTNFLQWARIATNTAAADGTIVFTDGGAAGASLRYYRAVLIE